MNKFRDQFWIQISSREQFYIELNSYHHGLNICTREFVPDTCDLYLCIEKILFVFIRSFGPRQNTVEPGVLLGNLHFTRLFKNSNKTMKNGKTGKER